MKKKAEWCWVITESEPLAALGCLALVEAFLLSFHWNGLKQISFALTLNPALWSWRLTASRSAKATWAEVNINVGAIVKKLANF